MSKYNTSNTQVSEWSIAVREWAEKACIIKGLCTREAMVQFLYRMSKLD